MSRSEYMTRTHRCPAISADDDGRFGTLLGWYESEAEARGVVETFRNSKPVSFEELMGGPDDE